MENTEDTTGIVVRWRVEISRKAWEIFAGTDAEKYRGVREWCLGHKLHCSRPDPERFDLVETHTREEAQEIFEALSLAYDFQAKPPFRVVLNLAEIEAEKIEKWKEQSMFGDDDTADKARKALRRRNIEPPLRNSKRKREA